MEQFIIGMYGWLVLFILAIILLWKDYKESCEHFGHSPQMMTGYLIICLIGAPYWVVSVINERIHVFIVTKRVERMIRKLAKKQGMTSEEFIKHCRENGERSPNT
jgi:hypothetical protein